MVIKFAKTLWDYSQSFYGSIYVRHFRKRVKASFELAWWSIGCASALATLLTGLFIIMGIISFQQAEAFGAIILPWIFIGFGGIAVIGILFSFLDTLARYILKREPTAEISINDRIAAIEKDIKEMKASVKEIKDRLT